MESSSPPGRERILCFIAAALNRGGERVTPPVVLLLGPGGTGKTAILECVEADYLRDRPMVRLDLAKYTADGPIEIMIEISKGLRQSAKWLKKADFPLLSAGITVIGGGMAGGRSARRHLDWYQRLFDQGGDLHATSLEKLRSQWHAALADGDPRTRHDARLDLWRVLCAALLADLRDEFDTRMRWHAPSTTNCVLLLDGADAQNGAELLAALAECRKDSAAADPLLVVAARRTRPEPPPPGPPLPADLAVASDDVRLSYPTWKEAAPRAPRVLVRLADLGAGDVEPIVKSRVLGSMRYDQGFVHEVTGGHPGACCELDRVLRAARPGAAARDLITDAVEDSLLALLRPARMTDQELLAMAVYSMPRQPAPGPAARAFGSLELSEFDELDVEDRFLELMWGSRGAAGLVIDPLPRLLLARYLARDAGRWERVHRSMLDYFQESAADDPASVWYHRLALTGKLPAPGVQEVAAELDEMLPPQHPHGGGGYGGLSAQQWDDLLTAAAAAPNRIRRSSPGGQHLVPRDVVTQVAGVEQPGSRERGIARLLAARWLHGDRTLDPGHALADLIAHEYRQLAQAVPGDCRAFYARAMEFRDIARDWEDAR